MERDLKELVLRASTLSFVPNELRERCIEIARTKSPSLSLDLAVNTAVLDGYVGIEAIFIGRATRWLAMIRRDHGNEAFEEAVRTLTTRAHA